MITIAFLPSYTEGTEKTVGTISGQILLADGKTPVAGAKLIIYKNKKIVKVTESEKDGSYKIKNITVGNYRILVFFDESSEHISRSVAIKEGENKINFLSDDSKVVGSISGIIANQGGDPVQNAEVFVYGENKETSGGASNLVTVKKDGSFKIDNLLPGTYNIFVTALDYSEEKLSDISVKPLETTEVKVVLKTEGSISGKVTRKDGTPVPGIKLIAENLLEGQLQMQKVII